MASRSEEDSLVERDYQVDALRSHITRGGEGLKDVPAALARVIKDEAWRERIDWRTQQRFTFERFEEFVTAPPLAGLGATVGVVERLVRGDIEAERLLREVRKRPPGGQAPKVLADIKRVGLDGGGSRRAYVLDRLYREGRADLLARVEAGELSPYAAGVEAGIVRRTRGVPIDSPEHAIRALLRVFTADELRRALDGEDRRSGDEASVQ